MLLSQHTPDKIECGCDEAGRGCLAGPVYAAAVVLPRDYHNDLLNDSKQLSAKQRERLRPIIEHDAVAWAVAWVEACDIDKTNILKASIHAMNMAIKHLAGLGQEICVVGSDALSEPPQLLLIDGNRFYNETEIPYACIVKGDGKYLSIAAASILAKTHRDERMMQLHEQFPQYGWDKNKAYPTKDHYAAIAQYGITEWHRKSFKLYKSEL